MLNFKNMKQLFALLLSAAPLFLSAQNNAGAIIFTESVKMKIQLPEGPEGDEMRKMMPTEQKFESALYFTENTSLYRDADETSDDKEIKHENDGMEMKIVMQHPDNRVYRDLDKDLLVESKEFFGRSFLIKEKPEPKRWKLTDEQKQILGYNCRKALLQDTAKQVVAWFCPQIQLPFGPAQYADLPGMILEVSMDNGDRTYVASKITMGKPDEKKMEIPSKGKSVTRKEYDKIVAEKTKEMHAETGGGGMRVIIKN